MSGAELLLDGLTDGFHVSAALNLATQRAHDLTHVANTGGAQPANSGLD